MYLLPEALLSIIGSDSPHDPITFYLSGGGRMKPVFEIDKNDGPGFGIFVSFTRGVAFGIIIWRWVFIAGVEK